MKNGNRLWTWLKWLFGYGSPQPQINDAAKQKWAERLQSSLAYEERPNPHLSRHTRAGPLYRQAHCISDEDSHIPASPAVLIAPDAALTLLQSYGLDGMLTPEDDATLWAAVISAYWAKPHDAKINVPGLRFGIGTFDDDTDMKLQPIAGWCFERDDEKTLRTAGCHDRDVDGVIDTKLRALPGTTLFTLPFLRKDDEQPALPVMSIVVERPSIGKQEVVVYNGAQLGHLFGMGQTGVYTRVDGGWQESGRILADWVS